MQSFYDFVYNLFAGKTIVEQMSTLIIIGVIILAVTTIVNMIFKKKH